MKHSYVFAAGISALVLGCAADPGTQPHDMSAAQHEAMANQEQQAAQGHEAQHDPTATTESKQCGGRGGCWTSISNPTAQHTKDAADHRDLAAKHRAASTTLKDAEARACVGISDEDRDTSPFYHREDIASVSPFSVEVGSGKSRTMKVVGSTVVFRAVPSMTAEWLQRVVDCHVARAAAVGFDMPEMSYCPLEIKDVKATVTSTGDGFAVNVSSENAASVAEIQKRAGALKQ